MLLNALYVDFNSYFASVEQQLRPELRNRPMAVLPVLAETTCCIAASYEAKRLGIRTGTLVREARKLCPDITLVEARPALYVEYHHRLTAIVESCTHIEGVLSIDEMVCRLTGSQQQRDNAVALAQRIKNAIATRAGSALLCSIGIAPNIFLAKLASNMQKPDGCVVIEQQDLPDRLYSLQLGELHGVGRKMEARLQAQGINTLQQLYALNRQQLRSAWGSVEGEQMYDKLRGVDIPLQQRPRSSIGHSRVLPPPMRTHQAALSVLHQLLQKACRRLRSCHLRASRIRINIEFLNATSWSAENRCDPTDDTLQFIQALEHIWEKYPSHGATPYKASIVFSDLVEQSLAIMDIFRPASTTAAQNRLNQALDQLNMRYGKNTVYFGGAHNAVNQTPMRIAFNHIPNLEMENDRQSGRGKT